MMEFSLETETKWQENHGSDQLFREVEEQYALEVQRSVQEGPIYLLATSKGRKALKVSSLSRFELEYITRSLADLKKQGLDLIVAPLSTADGSHFFLWEDSYYFLMDWVKGRHCDYLDEQDAVAVAQALAHLHRASRDLRFSTVPDTRWLLGLWPLHFSRRLDQLKNFARLARKTSVPRAFDRLFVRDFEFYYRQSVDALEKLASSDYNELCHSTSFQAFCHRDLAYHNILINEHGPRFLDFDYSLVDLGLHDLADLLLRNLALVGWRWERARCILAAYDSVTPLEPRVFPVLEAFLQFPHEYWQIGVQYYQEKQQWSENYFLARYDRKLKSPDLRQRFLNTFTKVFA